MFSILGSLQSNTIKEDLNPPSTAKYGFASAISTVKAISFNKIQEHLCNLKDFEYRKIDIENDSTIATSFKLFAITADPIGYHKELLKILQNIMFKALGCQKDSDYDSVIETASKLFVVAVDPMGYHKGLFNIYQNMGTNLNIFDSLFGTNDQGSKNESTSLVSIDNDAQSFCYEDNDLMCVDTPFYLLTE